MNIEEIEKEIKENDAVILYFSGKNCGVCTALKPKLESSFKTTFPKIKQLYIKTNDYPKTAAFYSIFTVPSIIIFLDKKEIKRESRHISISQLIQSVKRPYGLFFS